MTNKTYDIQEGECVVFLYAYTIHLKLSIFQYTFILWSLDAPIGLEVNALENEDVSAEDLLSFARQVACGMVSRYNNGVLKYSMIYIRDKSAILYGRFFTICFLGISLVKSYNSS